MGRMKELEIKSNPGPQLETRAVTGLALETRADGAEKIVGYPIVFNSRSVLLWDFYEIVKPEAVTDTLVGSDVRALFSHDPANVLGREKSGTLKIKADDHGVHMELTPPDNTLGRDVTESVRRGDIDGMSFGFFTTNDRWYEDGDDTIRELLEIDLQEVSIVTWPAYPATDVAVRSRDAWRDSVRSAKATGRHPHVLRLQLELDTAATP